MKIENPNSVLWLNCWRRGVSRASKKLFFGLFRFFVCLLFCRLLWRDLSEMVSVMECDHSCSMETLYELCESRLYEGIGEEIARE